MTPEQVRSLIGEEVLVIAGRRRERGPLPAAPRFMSEFTRLATGEGLVDVVVPLPCSPRDTHEEIVEEVESAVAADLDSGSSVLVVADVTALTGDMFVHYPAATAYKKLAERVSTLAFVRRTMGGDPEATASAVSANFTHWERGQLTLIVIAASITDHACKELIGNDCISHMVAAVPRWSPYSRSHEEHSRVGDTHVAVRDLGGDVRARVQPGDFLPPAAYWAVP